MSTNNQQPRRLRQLPLLREALLEQHIEIKHLIQGVFVCEGQHLCQEIASMPGVYRRSIDQLIPYLQALVQLGLKHIIIFGIVDPKQKNPLGLAADAQDGIVQRALRAIKQHKINLTCIADACFCEYTDHGHCGVLHHNPDVTIDNTATLERLASLAVSLAEAGADMIAPSGMIDNTVAAMRAALDHNKYQHVPIMMYSVKYASAFYGPFRDAANGTPQFGNRHSYQMQPANRREAMLEATLDIDQGADMLIVKPALAYLDIIRDLRQQTHLPIVAYNVSGEYAMVKAAAKQGWLDEMAIITEQFLGMRRAGADLIITYHGEAFARAQQHI